MKDTPISDAMDRTAGLDPTGEVYALRRARPEYVQGAEDSRAAVLTPADDLGLPADLRAAIARRVALTSGNDLLIADYPLPTDDSLTDLASGATPAAPLLAAIARHSDIIARSPGQSTPEDLQALQQAGLSVPQVIALSELLAYVCFQIRITAGLRLLEQSAL